MNRRLFAVAAVAGLALWGTAALGQRTASWVLLPGSGTADGDFVIDETLRETNCIYKLGVDLKPSPGEALGDGSTVTGFGSVIANVVWESLWGFNSDVTWTVNPDLIFLTGDLTRKDDKTQELFDINAGQIPNFGPFSSADPVWVITIDWSLKVLAGGYRDYSPRRVGATVDTQDGDTSQVYIRRAGTEFDEPQTWPFPDFALRHWITTIPSPAVLTIVAGGWLGAVRRRR